MVLGFCTKPIFGHTTLHLRIINNQECQLASWIPVQFEKILFFLVLNLIFFIILDHFYMLMLKINFKK
jgi:hypothetical protein